MKMIKISKLFKSLKKINKTSKVKGKTENKPRFHPYRFFTGNLPFPPISTTKWKRNKANKINGKNSISTFPVKNISTRVATPVFSKRCQISTSIYKYIFLLKEKYRDGNKKYINGLKNKITEFLFRRKSI